MNPFDLPGPEFLGFYLLLGTLTLGAVLLVLVLEGRGDAPRLLRDPYLIAYLRAGRVEAVSVAAYALIARGALVLEGDEIRRAPDAKPPAHPLERAVHGAFEAPRRLSAAWSAPGVREAGDEMKARLQADGLLPDAAAQRGRRTAKAVALSILLLVAAVKLVVALVRHRFNVLFLIVLAVLFSVAVVKLLARRRTFRGDGVLRDVRGLMASSRRAGVPRAASSSPEALVLAAAAVGMAGRPFGDTASVRAARRSAGEGGHVGGGSSCGGASSCGGGGGCGGGGCGGCGGCGG